VKLVANAVNIVTGASGTGKSTLIKAIDYCLGASKCELPAHVRRRTAAVGVKWTSDDGEMVIGRIVPPVGQKTSTQMFTIAGRNLPLPANVGTFDGATTTDAAKAFIERAFGIGDMPGEPNASGDARGRATVRLVTPYLFVTKEVIYSESVLLHGLEKAKKAPDIIAAMPYFLRATDEASAIDELRLRQLKRVLEKKEANERSRAASESALKQRATSLIAEANRIGIASVLSAQASEMDMLGHLRAISETQLLATAYPTEGEFAALHSRRREILESVGVARRQLQATRTAVREAAGFEGAVTRQRDKLMLAEHLRLEDIAETCPVCEAPSDRGRETARALQATLLKVRSESVAIERVKPKFIEYDRSLDETITRFSDELRRVDDQIQSWLRQSEDASQLSDLNQLRAHLLGRISFFLETSANETRQPSGDFTVLRAEIAELESRLDRDAKEIKLRRAEARISRFASDAFADLPTVAPCVGSELNFSSRQPEVTVIEAGSGAVLRMPDVGSDQNYLAIHIALSFALQRYFETVEAPVPGVLVLDQVSRPYFPARGEHYDETVIVGREEDEEVQAMRKHIDFLFAETARRSGLQVLLIEHAYFADDPRYVAATRERWTRASGQALIPLDWPTRADV
jgi:hypothetical protein